MRKKGHGARLASGPGPGEQLLRSLDGHGGDGVDHGKLPMDRGKVGKELCKRHPCGVLCVSVSTSRLGGSTNKCALDWSRQNQRRIYLFLESLTNLSLHSQDIIALP